MSVQILRGDCRELLRSLPDESVDCCISSPPYWNLRAYLPDDHPDKHLEIGSEPTLQEWIANIVDVFRDVRRVLKPHGTCWLNFGDSYAGSRCGGDWGSSSLNGTQPHHSHQAFTAAQKNASAASRMTKSRRRDDEPIPRSDLKIAGLKPKDLVGQPWRAAFALQDDGWWLRQDVVWAKANPMPESVRDRCTKAHEYIFLLTKSNRARVWRAVDTRQWQWTRPTKEQRAERVPGVRPGTTVARWAGYDYYFDGDAIADPASANSHARTARAAAAGDLSHTPSGWATGTERAHDETLGRYSQHRNNGVGFGHGFDKEPKPRVVGQLVKHEDRDRDLASAGVRMGRGAGWRQAEAAAPRNASNRSETRKLLEGREAKQNESWDAAIGAGDILPTRNKRSVWMLPTQPFKGAHFATFPPELIRPCVLAGCPPGGLVLDPFGGSGTTGLVADREGRSAILMDLDERNVPMATDRIRGDAPLFAQVGTGT